MVLSSIPLEFKVKYADQVRKENECANQAAGKKIEEEMSAILNTCTPASTAL
jgi:hypothetical protein